MLVNLMLLLVADDGRYASSPLKPWFESLRNGWGQLCCGLADGIEVVDGDWDTRDGHYRVRLASGWTVWCKDPTTPTKRLCGCGTKKLWRMSGAQFLPVQSTASFQGPASDWAAGTFRSQYPI
jgi:hypothetical protein